MSPTKNKAYHELAANDSSRVNGLIKNFYFGLITQWPLRVSWGAITLAFTFATVVGIFFGLYPARNGLG